MNDTVPLLTYTEYSLNSAKRVQAPVIGESRWRLYVNGRELVTFMCTPRDLHFLALGFLQSEGLITELSDVLSLKVFEAEHRCYWYMPAIGLNTTLTMHVCAESVGAIDARVKGNPVAGLGPRILTSGCGGGVTFDDLSKEHAPLDSDLRVTVSQILHLVEQLNASATLYGMARGVHTSALAEGDRLVAVAEDVGRHNTLDKLRGMCLMQGIPTRDLIILTTGRISSEMITKAAKLEAPVVVSRTSPTALSIRLAQEWGITLIGYARARRFNVYAGEERVRFDSLPDLSSGDSIARPVNVARPEKLPVDRMGRVVTLLSGERESPLDD